MPTPRPETSLVVSAVEKPAENSSSSAPRMSIAAACSASIRPLLERLARDRLRDRRRARLRGPR